jgi:hypothetical protein
MIFGTRTSLRFLGHRVVDWLGSSKNAIRAFWITTFFVAIGTNVLVLLLGPRGDFQQELVRGVLLLVGAPAFTCVFVVTFLFLSKILKEVFTSFLGWIARRTH